MRYHGVLAPCASLRGRVVPRSDPDLGPGTDADIGESSAAARGSPPEGAQPGPSCEHRASPNTPQRLRRAALLQRVFAIDALRCPRCGSTLRLVAAIEDPASARRILECIGLPARAPPLTPAAGSGAREPGAAPDASWDFDQRPPDEDP